MTTSKDYEDMTMQSWEHPYEQISYTIYRERKMIEPVRTHTRSNHDFHMGRFGRCVYCENGCKIKEEEEEKRIV
jgi:hypothetical protein